MYAGSLRGLLVSILLVIVLPTMTVSSKTKASKASPAAGPLTPPKVDPSDWPHGGVFVQPGDDTTVIGLGRNRPVPLGLPFDIESPLFKGKMLLRFRSAPSDDPASHDAYFGGRKRLMQTVVQGRFKRPLGMGDVYVGMVLPERLAGPPPPLMTRVIEATVRRVAPGMVLDLGSEAPRVLALLGGTAQTMSVDPPGSEPDMAAPVIEENAAHALGKGASTRTKRRKALSSSKKAAPHEFDTESVYTFHTYDDAMDYGRGTMRLPYYGEYDIKPMIGPQPWSLTALTTDGEVVYDLRVWHGAGR